MADKSNSTVYIGNLDEKVSDRVLYDILIQAGRVVDLHIPRDRETDKPKGFAFAEYESEEVATYAVKLFSGLVTLYKKTLKFAISRQDKSAASLPTATTPLVNSSLKSRPYHLPYDNTEFSSQSLRLTSSCRFSENKINYAQGLGSAELGIPPNQEKLGLEIDPHQMMPEPVLGPKFMMFKKKGVAWIWNAAEENGEMMTNALT